MLSLQVAFLTLILIVLSKSPFPFLNPKKLVNATCLPFRPMTIVYPEIIGTCRDNRVRASHDTTLAFSSKPWGPVRLFFM